MTNNAWVTKVSSLSRGQKLLVIGVAGALAMLVVAGVLFVGRHPEPETQPAYNPFRTQAIALERQTPPTDPLQRAIYYGQIAQNYQQLKAWDKALQNFQKAQAVIEAAQLQNDYVFYQAIADTYRSLGDASQERSYLQKQLTFLQTYAQQHPDDDSTAKAIEAVEERLSKL